MKDTLAEVHGLLASARADYSTRLPAKVAEISALVTRCNWPEARRAAHNLRGSAATYGFSALGAFAGRIEDLLLTVSGPVDESVRASIAALLTDVEREAGEAIASTKPKETS